ncbi:hypothetical protein PLICRDRAFT_170175 [Plicaturopsis crispa FD-325 SS-3]|nr:hypothetical protein PLICRDRAFT_170175 [Plicaturopsis crispa FD-325 SS-3]
MAPLSLSYVTNPGRVSLSGIKQHWAEEVPSDESAVSLAPQIAKGKLGPSGVVRIFTSSIDTPVHVTDLSVQSTINHFTGTGFSPRNCCADWVQVKGCTDSLPYAAGLAAQDVAARCRAEVGIHTLYVALRVTGGTGTRTRSPGSRFSVLRPLCARANHAMYLDIVVFMLSEHRDYGR